MRKKPKKRSPMAAALEDPKYRQRRVPGKVKDPPRKRKHREKEQGSCCMTT